MDPTQVGSVKRTPASEMFVGEKGKKIYLLFLERIDFVTFLENVAL